MIRLQSGYYGFYDKGVNALLSVMHNVYAIASGADPNANIGEFQLGAIQSYNDFKNIVDNPYVHDIYIIVAEEILECDSGDGTCYYETVDAHAFIADDQHHVYEIAAPDFYIDSIQDNGRYVALLVQNNHLAYKVQTADILDVQDGQLVLKGI